MSPPSSQVHSEYGSPRHLHRYSCDPSSPWRAAGKEGGNTLSIQHTMNQMLTDRQTRDRQADKQTDVLTDDPLNLSDMLKQLVL